METIGKGRNRITLSLPSRLELLGVIDKIADGITEYLEFEDVDKDAVAISVIEACTNAMEHGNRLQEDELVEVHFDFQDDRITVTVMDNGQGFDFEVWQTPTDVMRERGRGILIMREFTDELEFGRAVDGRFRVQLSKRFNHQE